MSQPPDPETTVDTRMASPQVLAMPDCSDACLVQIYPTGPAIDKRIILRTTSVVLGRGADCTIRLDDFAVSRRHAMIQPDGDGYAVIDLESTNGTFVNQVRIVQHKLKDGDNVHIGNAIFRFLEPGNVEAVYHEEIQRLAVIDPLTEMHNQRFLREFLERELLRSERYGRALALLMIDVDHFKTVNDQLGHLAGDFTLRELSTCLKNLIRKEGLLSRYGGEEFVAVLPETNLEAAAAAAERIRTHIEQQPFEYGGRRYSVTISIGVAATPGSEALTADEFICQADAKLYQAKRQGRNCVVASTD